MAQEAIFIGWGAPVRGREQKGLEVFQESVGTWNGYQEDGKIDSFEVFLLQPHGGDLAGFAVLRGSAEQLSELRLSADFDRLTTRAGLIVEGLGVVRAVTGESLGEQIAIYQEAMNDLL